MDTSKFLGKFKDATLEHLQRMNELLLRLEAEPNRREDVRELMREVHTLKGESRMMGFGDLSDLAHAVEDVLKAQEAIGFADLAQVSDAIFEAFDDVERLLKEKLGEGASGVDVPARAAALRAVARREPAAPAAPPPPTGVVAERDGADSFGGLDLGDVELSDDAGSEAWEPPAGDATDYATAMRDAFGVPAGAVADAGVGTTSAAPPVRLGGGGSKIVERFRDAARAHLDRLNELLLQAEREPADTAELLVELGALRTQSRTMGFEDMADVAQAMEKAVEGLQHRGATAFAEAGDVLFGAVDAEEKLLAARTGGPATPVDVAALRSRLAALAAGAPGGSTAAPAPPASQGRGTPAGAAPAPPAAGGLDALRARHATMFRDATVEHLERMNALVLALETGTVGPDDTTDLMREIHTLKGESRMMGFGPMADLAHAIEDLLKTLEAGSFRDLAAHVDVLFESFDAEARLLSEHLGEKAAGIDLAGLVRRLRSAAGHEAPPVPAASAPPASAAVPVDALLAAAFHESAREHVAHARETLALPGAPAALARAMEALRSEARLAGFDDVQRAADAVLEAQAAGPAAAAQALDALDRLLDLSGARPRAAEPPARTVIAQPAVPPRAPAVQPLAPQPAPAPAPALAVAPKIDETVRISLARLEHLANLSGDIYLSHARSEERQRRLRQLLDLARRQLRVTGQLRQRLALAGRRMPQASESMQEAYDALAETVRSTQRGLQDLLRTDRDESLRVGHAIVEMRERVRELQLLPVSTLFDMYPRMVRDLAKGLGKRVTLVVEGGHVELDRKVIDEIRDPMVHLVRNAVDHGLETPDVRVAAGKSPQGALRLAARPEGDHVVIEIEDDGAGIDPAAIRRSAVRKGLISEEEAATLSDEHAIGLIFAPGFSSKDEVSDVSGRGVGLDVVRDRIERLEGRITVVSEPGRGTRMALHLPLTLAMARVLLLRAGGLLLALPSAMVEEVLRIPESDVRRVETYEVMDWHDRTVPLVSLAGLLEREPRPGATDRRTVAILSFEESRVAFVVDELVGEREVVIKRLDEFLGRVPNVAGATLLSSGEIVTVLHVPQLLASTTGQSPVRLRARLAPPSEASPLRRRGRRLLVVDDSIIVRDMMKGVLEAAGFDVTLAVDGLDGLEKELAESFDLVITDVEMPRMDGFELTRSIKQNEQHSRVPMIIVTTLDSPEAREKGLRAGASAYIVKNLLDMSQLVDTIERLIA